jgi:hypothetical protein
MPVRSPTHLSPSLTGTIKCSFGVPPYMIHGPHFARVNVPNVSTANLPPTLLFLPKPRPSKLPSQGWETPNADHRPLLEAGARHEQTLEAVGCSACLRQSGPLNPRRLRVPPRLLKNSATPSHFLDRTLTVLPIRTVHWISKSVATARARHESGVRTGVPHGGPAARSALGQR